MKIYEIGTGYTPIPAQVGAATEIVVEELTKSFLKSGCDVEIIDIAAQNRAEHNLPIVEVKVPECFTRQDVQLGMMHKLKRVAYSIALAGKLRKILKGSKEKVVLHFHNQYNLFFFLKLTSKKLRDQALIAYTNHSGVWRLPWAEIKSTIQKRYFQEAECMKKADIVFVLNQETIDNAVEHLAIPRESFIKINNGVNVDIYHPLTEEEKTRVKKQYGLDGKKVILQVGSVYENKGQGRAVELLAPLLKRDKNLVYTYAGGIVSEEYHDSVKKLANKYGIASQVRYMGMIEPGRNLNSLYNIAEATILLSRYEAFGMVVIESLSAGTPVLLEKGTFFDSEAGCIEFTQERFAEIVATMLSDSEQIQKNRDIARQNGVQNYSWDKIAQDYSAAWGVKKNG